MVTAIAPPPESDTARDDVLVPVALPRWVLADLRRRAVSEARSQRANAKHAKGLGRMKLHATFALALAKWEAVLAQLDAALAAVEDET